MVSITFVILVGSARLSALSVRFLILSAVLLILLVRFLDLLLLPVTLLVVLPRCMLAISILIAIARFRVVVRLLLYLLGHPLRLSIALHRPCSRIVSIVILVLSLGRRLLILLMVPVVRHLSANEAKLEPARVCRIMCSVSQAEAYGFSKAPGPDKEGWLTCYRSDSNE